MVPLSSLILPIVVSAVIVFVVSSIIHMVLPYHRTDFQKLPKEDEVQDALRRFSIPAADYILPCPEGPAGMSKPDFVAKRNKGPVVFMTVLPGGPVSMTQSLVLWFIYSLVVGLFAGYIASRALSPGVHYLEVFRFVGASAFMGYALALLQNSIWFHRNWGFTLKSMFDGLVYALLTAGTFGWLWPR